MSPFYLSANELGYVQLLKSLIIFTNQKNSMESLLAFLKLQGFKKEENQSIVQSFKKVQLTKGEYFVKEGKVATQLGFVESGQLQFYTTVNEYEERTTYVSLENTFVASLLSYLNEVPARENIRALTDSVLWIIEKKDVCNLQSQISAFKDFYIKLIEYQLCCIDKSRLDFITLSAQERYNLLQIQEPRLFQEVPLQYISSMLGISPRHLSRLRKIV
jgi:CRP-like cAMP-binding protein